MIEAPVSHCRRQLDRSPQRVGLTGNGNKARLSAQVNQTGEQHTMSITTYKGVIQAGNIVAEFRSDFSNVGTDLLRISSVDANGNNPQTNRAEAAPGGFARASVSPNAEGLLEVWVVAGDGDTSGRLTVTRNGAAVSSSDEAISGSVRWVYTVLEDI